MLFGTMKLCDKFPIVLWLLLAALLLVQQRIKLNMKLVDPCLQIKLHY